MKGYPPESATFDRLTDAREWAAKTETAIKEGKYFGASRKHTLAELLDKYEADRAARGRLSVSTKSCLKVWRERWGHELLSAITAERLNDERDHFKNAPAVTPVRRGPAKKEPGAYQVRDRADGTVNRHMRDLSAALGHGVKLGWLALNPSTRSIKLSEPSGRVRFLDDDELPRFLAAVKAAGITDFRRHDMRHCAASYLVMAGVDLVSVARILGHRQIQMTMRYSRLASERVVELGDKLASKLEGAA